MRESQSLAVKAYMGAGSVLLPGYKVWLWQSMCWLLDLWHGDDHCGAAYRADRDKRIEAYQRMHGWIQ